MGPLDLAKAAKLLTDIQAVGREADFDGVDIITADLEFLQQATVHVNAQGEVSPHLHGSWS